MCVSYFGSGVLVSVSRRSRRNRYKKAPVVQQHSVPGVREQILTLLGRDGYSNAAAFLGDDSPLLSAGTFARNTLTSNPELLTTMYRVNWLCKRIIDMPTEDMTRAWYKLSTSVSEEELHDSDADPGLWDCFDYYAAGDGFYCGVECGDCATDGCQLCNRGFSGYGNL